jgi:hypothetical protein
MEKRISTYMLDAEAELALLVAALSEEARENVFKFFKRKMASSYRNGYKAGAGVKPESASVETTERA